MAGFAIEADKTFELVGGLQMSWEVMRMKTSQKVIDG